MKVKSVRFIRSAPNWNTLPDENRTEIAFVGRSNVGKSSLLNYLVGRKAIAHTSGTPGKTAALNFYLVNEDQKDGGFYLVDLPGYGYAKTARTQREAWQSLIGRYTTEREQLAAVVLLIDSRHLTTKMDEELIELLRGGPVPAIIALTKSDKLSSNQQRSRVSELAKILAVRGVEWPIVLTSSAKKTGADELWRWISLLADL